MSSYKVTRAPFPYIIPAHEKKRNLPILETFIPKSLATFSINDILR